MIDVKYRELFGVPMYKFSYPRHHETKQGFVEYLQNTNNTFTTKRNDNTFLSYPDLHKKELFNPLYSFIRECLSVTFIDMGFVPSFDITSMWGVRHVRGGSHHRHFHFNTFLAGVYYLDGDSEQSEGTRFYPPYSNHKMIVPRMISNNVKPNMSRVIRFEEGSVVIFPAWLEHEVSENNSDMERNTIAFNCMPVGETNYSRFDRYDYRSLEGVNMNSDVTTSIAAKS